MNSWNNLSMKERADVMKLFIDKGIYDLDTIRNGYNKFAEGGDTGNKLPIGGPILIGTAARGAVKAAKQRLYENLSPIGYEDLSRVPKAIFLNEPDVYHNTMKNMPVLDEIYAQYLGIPEEHRHFNTRLEKSKYKPSQGGEDVTYYRLPQKTIDGRTILGDDHKYTGISDTSVDAMVFDATYMNPGENKQQLNTELGYYTVGRGRDNKGDYVSYYDKWDINPFSGRLQNHTAIPLSIRKTLKDINLDFGVPVNIYDRIYFDDYYGIKGDARGGHYLPEIIVTGKKNEWKHAFGGNLFDGTSQPTQQMQLGSAYWKQQARKPIFTTELAKFNKRKAEESRQRIEEFKKWAATKGKGLAEKSQKDYLTTSNDNTWVENRNPMVKASKPKNPHLTERSVKGAKAHRAWEEEHPVLNTWENILGAVPFAVASAPLAAAAGSGIAALGDAAAATSAGQAAIAGLTPLVTAASTNVAGAPLYTWADAGLSSLFGAHGIQTAIDEGGISPTTALEIAPLGRLVKPMWDAGKQGLQYTTKAIDNTTRYASPSYDLYRTVDGTPIINRSFPTKSLYRADVYKGGEIKDLHNISLTTDPKYAEQYGEVTPYLFESNSIAKAKEPLMGYRDPVNNDMFIYRNTKDVPGANAIVGHDLVTGEFPYNSKGTEIISLSPDNIYPKPLETPTIGWADAANTTPKVNWDADNWFKTISGRSSYSSEEAAELASHVPEYRAIEQRLFDEGKLDLDLNGNIVVIGSKMSPQEYIMRQSRAFQKMNHEHHYVGVSKNLRNGFENESRDPATKNRYEVWTDRKSPKNVEEYAESRQGGSTNDSNIEKLQDEIAIREENYKLHQEQLKWKYEHGKISQETYNQDLKSLKDRYDEKQKEAQKQLDILVQQKRKDPLNGGKVFDVTYPKEAIETPIINAENNHWTSIPFDNIVRDAPSVVTHYKQRPYNNKLQTDQVISAARRNGYDVTHIDNVMDTYNGTMMNETIIGRNTPVKSVLGNTGNFDIESPNKWRLYRSILPLLPFGVGLTGYGLFNNQEALGGKIKKRKR